jgi:ligand-binding sensor domain-containing protein
VSASLKKYIHFERYSTADGLSNNMVFSIAQDKLGFMWFATENGLNKFDGHEFKVFRHESEDPASLPDNQCRVVFVDQTGRVWVGTQHGLALYDRETETFQRFQHDPEDPTSVSHDRIVSISETLDGLILVGTEDGGLNALDTETGAFRNIRHDANDPDSLSPGWVSYVRQTADGTVWVGTRVGRNSGALDRLDTSLTTISHVVSTCDDDSAACTTPGADHLAGAVERIYEDRDGRIWVSAGGVSLLDPTTGKLTHFRHAPDDPNSLSNDAVLPLIQDRQGNFWVGTYFGGLNRAIGTFPRTLRA